MSMAERGESSDEEPTIAEDVVVTKYKMAGDMANRMSSYSLLLEHTVFIEVFPRSAHSHTLCCCIDVPFCPVSLRYFFLLPFTSSTLLSSLSPIFHSLCMPCSSLVSCLLFPLPPPSFLRLFLISHFYIHPSISVFSSLASLRRIS